MSEITVYTFGLIHCSVCAPKDLPIEEVTKGADQEHPTGLSHGWQKSSEDTFSGGEPNPCPCNSDPERLHWLLDC